jgi:hypothetical protein
MDQIKPRLKSSKRWRYGYAACGQVLWRQHRKRKGFCQLLLTNGKWRLINKQKENEICMEIIVKTHKLSVYRFSDLTEAEVKYIKLQMLILEDN